MQRPLRDATFEIEMRREKGASKVVVAVDGEALPNNRITRVDRGRTYKVEVNIPACD